MSETTMLLLYGAFVLFFGVVLSASFAGVRLTKQNNLILLGIGIFCGGLQISALVIWGVDAVWRLYPIITHLPLILLLWKNYHKYLVTAVAAVFASYMCCQPANWLGVMIEEMGASDFWEYGVQIAALTVSAYFVRRFISPYLSHIFNKSRSSAMFFGSIPTVYYQFDYITSVYSDLWVKYNRAISEFMPMFIMLLYMALCVIYMKLSEEKEDALRKEEIIRVTLAQQDKEIKAVKQAERELSLLRHDMRMFLSSLAISIEHNETDKARQMIDGYTKRIEQTRLQRFCGNDTINYVLSDYAERCRREHVTFRFVVELDDLEVDELMFCSVLSNALDNALNAQRLIPKGKRSVRATLKTADGRLLLSVKNPIGRNVVFSDGLPVSAERGHGYGTQSIRYLTERLGGNCQFSVEDDTFILRVII